MSSRKTVALLVLCACAPAPSGVLTGRAIFEGEDDHAGIIVSLPGASTVTGPDGRFTFRALAPGPTSALFAAADSVEVTQARTAEVGVELADVVFHATGRVTGRR